MRHYFDANKFIDLQVKVINAEFIMWCLCLYQFQDMEDKKIIETGEPVVLAGCLFFIDG